MQRTADFHDAIANAGLPEAVSVMDNATAFDAAVDMFDAHAAAGNAPIRRFLRARQGPAPRLAGRHDHLDRVGRERQEAQILEQAAARGQRIRVASAMRLSWVLPG